MLNSCSSVAELPQRNFSPTLPPFRRSFHNRPKSVFVRSLGEFGRFVMAEFAIQGAVALDPTKPPLRQRLPPTSQKECECAAGVSFATLILLSDD